MSGAPENKIGIGIGSSGGDKPQQQLQQQIAIQKSGTTTFPINLASGKLTHVKSTTIDTLKVAPIVQQQSANIGGIQQQAATATFRINASGQPTITTGGPQPHVRVVMPLMPQGMIKQIDNTTGGLRTQITAIPAARTISQTSITVTRPVTPTTYIPRAGVTATNIQTQRLQAPIRTPTPPTVTGLSAANFVRGTTVARNSSSPATTVISPTNATWMAGGTGQVQLIRAINQPRQRLITQNIASSVAGGTTAGTTTGVVAVGQTNIGVNQNQIVTNNQNSQQTFVATLATVLPPRQQTATLVYSNVSNSQGQQYTPTGGTTTQRFTVAAASLAGAGNNQRRPIQLGNRTFSTAKLGVGGMNTTSISIRAPNIPVLTPAINTVNSNVIGGGNLTGGTIQARATTGNVNLSTNSLTTTRIIQLQQQQPGTGGQQIIGSTGRLTSNLMLQPIIMNTTGGGKIGIRPTTTVTSKVQPSLTITQLGLGKLTPNQQQQSTITNLQGATISQQQQSTLNTSSGVVVSASGNIVQSQQQSSPITQIVSVNQQNISGTTGQIITTQNVSSSVGGGTTVLPLAIQSSKIGGTNVFTGTITPIKSTGTTISTPITKVLQQQHQTISVSASGQQQQQQQITEIITSTQSGQQHHQPTNVFIHTRPQTTVGGSNIVSGNNGGNTTTVIPVSSGTFLPAGGGTFYYESVPANSVTVSTGVLSLTTTTVTSSVSQSQTVSTTTNLPSGIVTTIPYSPGTFTVVPSVGSNSVVGGINNLNSNNIVSNRTIGQIQIPVSSTVNTGNIGAVNVSQIQTVPIRFNPHHNISTAGNSSNDQIVPVTAQLASGNTILQQNTGQQIQSQQISQSTQQQQSQHHHQIINMTGVAQQSLASGGSTIVQTTNQQIGSTAMLIPVQTSIKLTGGNNVATVTSSPSRGITNLGSINTAFLRKRDNDGSPIRAAKNLQPTLMAMSSGNSSCNINNSGIGQAGNSGTSASTVVTLSGPTISSLTNKIITSVITEQQQQKQQQHQQQQISLCKERPISPGSSGGSTTVSANSSPGVDQQINEELTPINRMTESHFNPINDLYPYHQNQISSAVAIRRQQQQQQLQQQQHDHTSNGTIECTPRKKSRRSTNDSQNSSASHHHQQNSNQQQIPHSNNQQNNITSSSVTAPNLNNINNSQDNNNQKIVVNNKENAKPTTDFILKKPRTCNLLDSYKQNWKSANNHFQRHSDVKPREERRPTVMDLANQAHVAQRINGWKIHHLSAQMEDLSEIEAQVYDKLGDMLKKIELHGKQHSDIDRVSDLIKGNMQRSKIISDGVNDARGQILKIFDHKSHVSDIIHRCASKRNFKKREKP